MSLVRAVLLNRISVLLALAGIVASGTLTYAAFARIVVPCGIGGSGCAQVAAHPSSVWFGLPVALYGLVGYILILGLSLARMFLGIEKTRKIGLITYAGTLIGAVVSLVLQVYSGTVIGAWCTWCVASAAIMTLLFIVQAALAQVSTAPSPAEAPTAAPKGRRADGLILAIAGLATVGAMVYTTKLTNDADGSSTVFQLSETNAESLIPENAHSKGDADAKITIVEFGDLTCPACQQAYALLSDIYKEYGGRLRIVFRHFPLIDRHPEAFRAAVYAEYAGTKGRFWDFLDRVYQIDPQQMHRKETFENVLLGLNLDMEEATKQFEDASSASFERVYHDLEAANNLGIQVTPTFFLVAEGEKPYSTSIRKITERLESDAKYRQLLGKSGG
jgi:protein-disulfide isomerase